MSRKRQQQALFANLKRLSTIYPSLEGRLAAAAEANHPYVLRALELFAPEQSRSIDTWRKAYALTEAEARLALAIANGGKPTDYAAENGVSVHTVRAQLKTIFQKTGVKRQAELVVLLGGRTGMTG